MAVNTVPPPSPFAATSPRPGAARLYLREEELDEGLALVFDAAASLKAATEADRVTLDLSWADARTLAAAARKPETVQGLAARLAVSKQALGKTLLGLEARGLILRTSDSRDGRRRIVVVTDTGRAAEQKLATAMRARLANAYRSCGDEAVRGSDQVLLAIAGRRAASNTGKTS